MRYYDNFWNPIYEPISILNRHTGQEMDGVIVRHQYYGEIINWSRGSGPIVPMQRLYEDGGTDWAVQKRKRAYDDAWKARKLSKAKEARIQEVLSRLALIFCFGALLLSGCVVYPDGRMAGAFDESAINAELARTAKQNGQ